MMLSDGTELKRQQSFTVPTSICQQRDRLN